jgi:hypothetical protein
MLSCFVNFKLLLSINDIDNIWNLSFVHFVQIGFIHMYEWSISTVCRID